MQKRIFLTFITLVLIGILITAILSLSLLRVSHINSLKENLVSSSKLIGESILQIENVNEKYLENIAKSYSKHVDARISFIDKDGWVLGDSTVDIENLENHKDRPEIVEAFNGEIGISQRYSESIGKDMLYVAVPFDSENTNLSVIRLSVLIKDINVENKVLLKYTAISIFAGLVVAILLGLRYVRIITEPIRELTLATKKISNGSFDEKVHSNTDDEIGELSANFNIMSAKLKSTVGELQESNTKMRAILTSMLNGVIALDKYNHIILVNPSAEETFGISENEVKGKHILEVIRNNVMDELIDNMAKENDILEYEIEIDEPKHRILDIYSSMIRLSSDPNRTLGIVMIIHDVTEIRKLEDMRKDFVANVSHELKTPLTSIKGFIDTLKEGAAENKKVREKFLDILDIETSRLTALIQDLLMLSEIENNSSSVNHERINVNKSIEDIMDILNEMAKQKNIRLINNAEENLPSLKGKEGWFKQMLINLVDNGIKYTPSGGSITVEAYCKLGKLCIKVIDTGIGIEEEHLARLFERFYRVDKARSRQVGGTGLGLAIVKHIVIGMSGNINVKSKVNKGTEFTILLPIKDI